MKEIHIKDVMNTGYFINWQIFKQNIPQNPSEESIYLINYFAESLAKYEEYMSDKAPHLQKEHTERFRGKFKASRSLYTEVQK